MNENKCGRCADQRPCLDHPDAIIGTKWTWDRFEETIAAWVPSRDRWLAIDQNEATTLVEAAQIAGWHRVPPPMPELRTDKEHWVEVYVDGDISHYTYSTVDVALTETGREIVGAVKLVPDPTTWTPRPTA